MRDRNGLNMFNKFDSIYRHIMSLTMKNKVEASFYTCTRLTDKNKYKYYTIVNWLDLIKRACDADRKFRINHMWSKYL